jgi:hypothetical protein
MLCQSPSDVFEPAARDLLFGVAQTYLEQIRTTATELMFDPREHRKILNAATKFQEYLQRVAILQGAHSQRPVAERMRQTLEMVDGAMRAVEAAARAAQTAPALDAAALDGCAQKSPLDAGVALALALAAAPPGDFVARAVLCFRLLGDAKTPVAVELLDQTLAQMLRLKVAAVALIGPAEALATQIRACLAIAGDPEAIAANRTAFVGEIARLGKLHALPHVMRAAVAMLNAALASPALLAARDPLAELAITRDLHKKIAALPLLAADPQLAENLSRRMSRLVVPESLDPLLAREMGVGRKLLVLIRLTNEIDDANARRHLDAMAASLIESRDFKDEFFAPGLAADEKRAALGEVGEAVAASTLAHARKLRYREVAALAFVDLAQAGGRRLSPRMSAGPEDRVQLMGQRVALRNWSETGLLFGPYSGVLKPGQTLRASVLLRNAYISIGFEASLEIVRFADGLVGAKYTCLDAGLRARIKAHFATA